MAEPLKNQFGRRVPEQIAAMITGVHRRFPTDLFLRRVMLGYEELELMPRARKIAHQLRQHLPSDFTKAVAILVQSLGPKLIGTESFGMAPFLYLPHVFFVAEFGLEHFDCSMQAQYELTQRFTAEYSIRPFIEKHPAATLKQLKVWAQDPSSHVRRLVSEGTRPRLPWAPRLRQFQIDPQPVLKLLELLKDDSELYVRRSVANNLNDIGKDHPDKLIDVTTRWLKDATPERQWIVGHALRSAVKRAEPAALSLLGYQHTRDIKIVASKFSPIAPRIGGRVNISIDLENVSTKRIPLLVDLIVHFVKANAKTAPKVFKLKTEVLEPRAQVNFSKVISLCEMTTRKHYPGCHHVDILINGTALPIGSFALTS